MNIVAHTTLRSRNKIILQQRHVTLLEMIIVIAILSLIAGIIGMGIRQSILDQKFRNEVSMVVDQMRLAQDLMLILGTDVHLKFAADDKEKGIRLWIETESKLYGPVQKEIDRQQHFLTAIHGVFFDDQTDHFHKKEHLDILFLSKGAVMSNGILRLSLTDRDPAPEGEVQNFICLKGYPAPISAKETYELAASSCNEEKEKDFNKRLTDDTLQRIPDKLKTKPSSPPIEQKAEEPEKTPEEKPDNPKTPAKPTRK